MEGLFDQGRMATAWAGDYAHRVVAQGQEF
jgi:hypothetical protein